MEGYRGVIIAEGRIFSTFLQLDAFLLQSLSNSKARCWREVVSRRNWYFEVGETTLHMRVNGKDNCEKADAYKQT